ncbi:acyltransferase family protein [Peribacillus sp. NPDC097197]|uniref:acyltransferase family protein n=1 Tax=Peribacillus sp. NPDC097197 TaxID=3390615 RepID=UPI003CFFDA07
MNQFTRLGTPVFAVLSAFLLFSSVKNRGFNLKKFMLSRTTKIVFPFIIWTTAYLIYLSYTGWEFHENKLIFIFSNYVLGEGFYHLYFIVTIIQFYCIFPLLQLVRNKSTLLLLFFISLPLNYLSLLIFDNKLFLGNLGGIEHIIIHSSFVMNWISYFLLGAVIAYYYPNIKDFCNKNVKLLTFLFFTVILAISFEINPDSLFVSARPINLVYIPVFVLFLLSIYQFIAKNEPDLIL